VAEKLPHEVAHPRRIQNADAFFERKGPSDGESDCHTIATLVIVDHHIELG
jgi:hypothetical protein